MSTPKQKPVYPWPIIAAACISGTMTLREASARFGIPIGTLCARSARDKWFAKNDNAGDSGEPGTPETGEPSTDPSEVSTIDTGDQGITGSGDQSNGEIDAGDQGIRDAINDAIPCSTDRKAVVPHAIKPQSDAIAPKNSQKPTQSGRNLTEMDVVRGIADAIRENRDKFKGTVARKLAKVADHIEGLPDKEVIEKADKIKSLAQAGKEVWGEQEKAPAANLVVSFSFLTDPNAPAPIDIDGEVIG